MRRNRLLFTLIGLAIAILSMATILDSPAPTLAQSVGPSPTVSVEPSVTATTVTSPTVTATTTTTPTVTATVPTTATATATATSTPTSRDMHLALVMRAANPTATPTVTPSPTPLPECNAYFDDFSNPNSGWQVGENQAVRARYTNNEYEVRVKLDGYIVFLGSPADAYSTYTIESDIRWDGTVGFTYGVLFGITEDGAFYLFEVYPNGQQYAVTYWPADPNAPAELITNGSSAAIQTGNGVNHVSVTNSGNQQTYAVNDVVVTTTNVNHSGARYTGVSASAYGAGNVDARFDDFCITVPTSAEAAGERPVTPILDALEAREVPTWFRK